MIFFSRHYDPLFDVAPSQSVLPSSLLPFRLFLPFCCFDHFCPFPIIHQSLPIPMSSSSRFFSPLLPPLPAFLSSPTTPSFFSLLFLSLPPLLLSLWLLTTFRLRRHFPPGPMPFPLIGNLAQIDFANPHSTFIAWKRRYGPIFTVWLPNPQVVVAGAHEIDELFLGTKYSNIFADRPTHSFLYGLFSKHQLHGDGIILARSEVAQKHRRFALSAFRQLGMGRPQMEARINTHKDALVRRLVESAKHRPILDDLSSQLTFCIGNIIQDLVLGRHYDYNDEEFLLFKQLIDRLIKEISSVQILLVDTHPFLRFFLPAFHRYRRDGFALQNFFLREVEGHVERLKANENAMGEETALEEANDFIDTFLLASREEGRQWADPALKLTLALSAGDLWAGGMETLVTTLTWAVLYLINFPEVQKKLHNELNEQLRGNALNSEDKNSLPYLRAFIDELQRIINVLPWNLPHSVSQTVTLPRVNGCCWTIPKDTRVMPQLGAVHLDSEVYPSPEEFWPDRFLDSAGSYDPGNKWLKPFGVGKRMCLGESLAKMELPLILAALVQNFEFDSLDSKEPPALSRNAGLTSTPNPYKVVPPLLKLGNNFVPIKVHYSSSSG